MFAACTYGPISVSSYPVQTFFGCCTQKLKKVLFLLLGACKGDNGHVFCVQLGVTKTLILFVFLIREHLSKIFSLHRMMTSVVLYTLMQVLLMA